MDAAVDTLDQALANAKRNVAILSVVQAIQGAVAPISISLAALAGYQLLADDKSLATARPLASMSARPLALRS